MTQIFIHPDTGRQYALKDTQRYFSIYSDFPQRVGQVITAEDFRKVNGEWMRNGTHQIIVDEQDILDECV